MKRLLLLLIFISGIANAQIVSIPDTGFKDALIALGVDTNSDGNIQQSEALAVTSLDFASLLTFSIQDMTGISSFTNLNTLKIGVASGLQILDVSALTALTHLEVPQAVILSTLVLGNLPSLTYLDCSSCSISALDVSGTPNLTFLNCSQNYLTTLDASTLTQLTHLDVHFMPITSLDVSNSPNLSYLDCSNGLVGGSSGISSLNITGCVHLAHLDTKHNSIPTLDVSPLTELTYLNVQSNALSVLNVSNLTNLTELRCDGNNIGVLNVSALTNLTYLECTSNQIATLQVAPLSNLTHLGCSGNHITSLDMAGLTNLTYLDCGYNQIASLNVAPLINLTELYCNGNLLTNFSASTNLNLQTLAFGNPNLNAVDIGMLGNLKNVGYYGGLQHSLNVGGLNNLEGVQISQIDGSFDLSNLTTQSPMFVFTSYNNPSLTYLNLKTGYHINMILSNNDALENICTNDADLQYVTTQVNNGLNYANCVVSSYCSFTPGGSYNTISGTFHLDADNNGCTASDVVPPAVKININDGTNSGSTFTNNLGVYGAYAEAGTIVLTPQLENPAYFNVTPTSQTVVFANNNNNTSTNDFCMTANGVHPDIEVVVFPIVPARPGFDATYQVIVKNKGNQMMSGSFNFVYDDAVFDFVSSTNTPDIQSSGNVGWNYSNLNPFASINVIITLNGNAPTDTPPLNIGDILNFTAMDMVAGDEMPGDNTFTLQQMVVGSYDPNDKTCLQGNIVSPTKIGDYLDYNINFENTGTAAAENIVVEDLIDMAKFDIATLQLINASHPVTTRITGNKVEFMFENINLGANQHGNVVFKIKTKPTLVTGDIVTNKADIFFDYNFPVATNTASTVFQALGVNQNTFENAINIYPNPATGMVNLKSTSAIQSVNAFDAQGRVVATYIVNNTDATVDVSHLPHGIYYLKIVTDKGSGIEKLIKN